MKHLLLLASLLTPQLALAQQTTSPQLSTLPACSYEDILTPHMQLKDWPISLLDTIYMLPDSYAPEDLVSVREAGLNSDHKVRAIILPDLRDMTSAARAAGTPIEVQSAYRSYSYQQNTFQYWVEQEGYDAALVSSARPGHSEHQLGTSLDFRSENGVAPWDLEDWASTPAGAWMQEHAWQYGFVMSYPKDKSGITCYIYEPWHYRYIGKDNARALKESGLTLREWLWMQQ